MKGKNKNYDVKRMPNGSMIFIVLSWLVLCACMLCGCTKKSEAGMSLTPLSEETESSETDSVTVEQEAVSQAVTTAQEQESESQEPQVLYVHVCGAVAKPGVYELTEGSRVFEAVKKAGGFTEDADADYVNQAQIVPDGGMLVIPTYEQVQGLQEKQGEEQAFGIVIPVKSEESNSETLKETGLVNINTAGKEELSTLPGIGEAKAEAIIAYREQCGIFSSIEQIKEIEGIKDGLYVKIQDKICVN